MSGSPRTRSSARWTCVTTSKASRSPTRRSASTARTRRGGRRCVAGVMAAAASVRVVSERTELWLPGALAWVASVGWIPFVIAVAQPPSVAELTFLGARIVTSGAWPWNAVLIGAVGVALVLLAFALTAAANAVLIALLARRAPSAGDARRILAVNVVMALPAVLSTLVVLMALVAIAPREFNAPDPAGGPVLRTALRLMPYLVLLRGDGRRRCRPCRSCRPPRGRTAAPPRRGPSGGTGRGGPTALRNPRARGVPRAARLPGVLRSPARGALGSDRRAAGHRRWVRHRRPASCC